MSDIPIYKNPSPTPPFSMEPPSPPPKKKVSRELISTLIIIAAAPILALFLTVFVFQSYEVDGPSMETTLQHKDRLIVNKLEKTWSKVSTKDFQPNRYDVVVFNYSGSTLDGKEKQLIKRVIGLPGDRIVVKNDLVTVFNNQHPQGFEPDKEGPENTAITKTDGNIDETIEEGEVFVMGDNRENSLDSRVFGPIKSSDIVGKLALRIYPLDKVQRF